MVRQAFQVAYDYEVHFTRGLFDPANPLLREVVGDGPRRRVMAVLDAGVVAARPGLVDAMGHYAAMHHDALEWLQPALVLRGGEASKQGLASVQALLQAVADARLDRQAYVLAVGGGALLDVAGFAAAIARRGVRLLRVPTTTLAQVAAGVGVASGVNAFGRKDFLGAFAPPWAVLSDAEFLVSLDDRDWRAGAAMAVHAALLDDAAFFGWLEAHAARLVARDLGTMERLVQQTAALRLARFGQGGDPADAGPWAAHRLESLSADRLRHGEAVAIGLALDATYAMVMGMLAEADWRRVVGLLLALGFDLSCPELAGPSLTDGLEEFRAHRGGPLALTLPTGIGRAVAVREMDRDAIAEAVGGLARVQTAWQEGDWRWAS